MPDEKPVEPEAYVLGKAFYNGTALMEPGETMYFIPGKQPKSARLASDVEAEQEKADAEREKAAKAAAKK